MVLLAQAGRHLYRQQRVAAQRKEIIVAAHLFQPQQGLPEGGQHLLHFPLRGFIRVAGKGRAVRGGQRPAIQLAAGGQRKRRQHDKGAGQHVLHQAGAQLFPQPDRCQHRAGLGDQVGNQALVPVIPFTGNHNGILNAVTGRQLCLNFPRFNAESPDLDLKIIAAEVVNVAVGQPASQIPAFIHACTGLVTERIGNKFLRGERRLVQVTAGHARPPDMNFPADAGGHRLPVGVQNINAGIGIGPANRNDPGNRVGAVVESQVSGDDRGLGGTVGIDPAAGAGVRQGLPLRQVAELGLLPADNQGAQVRAEPDPARFHFLPPVMPERGGQIDDGNLLLRQVRNKRGIGNAKMGRAQHQRGARGQGRENI
ncbi:hypothetical protein Xsze_03729 [Xenorhabdus szentirmaii DSM 16338]|nr:hypothetical protein Xsze_03729 [Xenorhabdus szentirmaii DSM 16338]